MVSDRRTEPANRILPIGIEQCRDGPRIGQAVRGYGQSVPIEQCEFTDREAAKLTADLAGDAAQQLELGHGFQVELQDAGLDTGAMLSIATMPIEATDTSATLYEKLAVVGPEALVAALVELFADVQPRQGGLGTVGIQRMQQVDQALGQ